MPQTIPLALAVAEKAFREFQNQWLSGLKPSLSLETASDGQICVIFKVVAGAGEQERCLAEKVPQHHRRRSPSYRRRLIKRAAARAAAADTVMKRATAVKFVQTEAEKTPLYPDPVLPCRLAVEAEHHGAEHQPQHHPQYLPQDEVCSDETYAESLPLLCPATLPQLDGHNDSHVLNRSEINLTEFTDIIEKQEEDRRRDADRRRKERESDMEQFRKLLDDHLS